MADTFRLEKPQQSIFVGNTTFREYPDNELIYGFIENGCGIKIRKRNVQLYEDEQTHYRNYIKHIVIDDNFSYIKTQYTLSKHGWGRTNAINSLTLSSFHRPTRHSFADKNYIDLDMVNCQVRIAYEFAKINKIRDIEQLSTYCKDPKKVRKEIVDYYKLKDTRDNDGVVTTAMEKAKKLPIRLAFGGCINAWKTDFNVTCEEDMPFMIQLEKTFNEIKNRVWDANQHILEDISIHDKQKYEKIQFSTQKAKKTVMALFAQTWERIIQEECVAHLIRNYKDVKLQDIIPSQDGMMILKSQAVNINLEQLFKEFNAITKEKFKLNVKWTQKEFDEKYYIPSSSTLPISITIDDLELGEKHIAVTISPALKNKMRYSKNMWYSINNKNIWIPTKHANEFMIIDTLQKYIDTEKTRLSLSCAKEHNKDKVDELCKQIKELVKHYNKVGKSSYSKQLATYLSQILLDDNFHDKLDCTVGKLVFNDVILDLKTGLTKTIEPTDYVTFTVNSIDYLKLKPSDPIKKAFVMSQFKKIYNNNDVHLDYGLSAIGYSLTGDASKEKMVFCLKDGTDATHGNNGKSFIFRVLRAVFPEYVKSTSYIAFENNCNTRHKHVCGWSNIRILSCDEVSKNKAHSETLKQIGDGEFLDFEILFGTKSLIPIRFKLFMCANPRPNINDQAFFNRYKEMRMCSHFDPNRKQENPDLLEFKADTSLFDKLMDGYKDELIRLFIEYSMKYYQKGGLPELPAEFEEATNETKLKNNDFAVWFYSVYEKSGIDSDRVHIDDINYNGFPTKEIIKQLKIIGIEYHENKRVSVIIDGKTVSKKGCIIGYKRVYKRVSNDCDDECSDDEMENENNCDLIEE